MQSRASIGGHPIHPLLVPLPIGAYFLGLVGNVVYLRTVVETPAESTRQSARSRAA
jgi:uncharacterized membrane protein